MSKNKFKKILLSALIFLGIALYGLAAASEVNGTLSTGGQNNSNNFNSNSITGTVGTNSRKTGQFANLDNQMAAIILIIAIILGIVYFSTTKRKKNRQLSA